MIVRAAPLLACLASIVPLLAACGAPPPAPVAAVPTATPIPPTATLLPPTATVVPPTATPSPEQRLQAAQAAMAGQDYLTALAHLNALKQGDPATPGLDDLLYQAHLFHGSALLNRGDLDGSYAQYGEALKLRPDDSVALYGQKQVVLAKHWNEMEAA
jgi:hypothetical protein